MADAKPHQRFNQEHYDRLIAGSEKQDFTEWNNWYWEQYTITYTNEKLGKIEIKINNFQINGLNGENIEISGRDIRVLEVHVLRKITFKGNGFEGAELEGAPLKGKYLKGAVLYEAHLEKAELEEANLEEAFLYKAHLKEAKLKKINAKNANLKEAKAERANLERANLERANLEGANLERANLERANLEGAKLSRSDLKGCDFVLANLQGANLSGADLREARLDQTDLRGADFIAAVVNEGTSLYDIKDSEAEKCKIDDKTQFAGVPLGSMRIKPSIRTKLEKNIRKRYWKIWYDEHLSQKDRFQFPRWSFDSETSTRVFQSLWRFSHKYVAHPFWWLSYNCVVRPFLWLSDYGTSTYKCILAFVALYLIAFFSYLSLTWNTIIASEDFQIAVEKLATETVLAMFGVGRPILPDAWVFLLAVQVICGYFLLAVIVSRFAIMFQSLSP